MYRIITIIIVALLVTPASAQKARKISTNLDFHLNRTIYDRTLSNNGVGFGLALQAQLNSNTKFTPALEIASDVYGGTKELFLTTDGKPIYAKSSVTTIVAGALYNVSPDFYSGGMIGAGFFNSKAYFAIKPVIGYQFLNKRLIAKISWVNIFQRDDISDQSFGYVSFGLGLKLF